MLRKKNFRNLQRSALDLPSSGVCSPKTKFGYFLQPFELSTSAAALLSLYFELALIFAMTSPYRKHSDA